MSVPSPAPAAAALQTLAEPVAAVPGLASLVGPVVVLLLLAGAALLLSRRRRGPTRRIQVLEQAALGPKRSLVLARLGDELLLLGSTDGGITLLRSQPAGGAARAGEPRGQAPDSGAPRAAPAPARAGALVDLASRLVHRRRAQHDPRSPAFEALLAESAEDQELRQKLARGQGGSVR